MSWSRLSLLWAATCLSAACAAEDPSEAIADAGTGPCEAPPECYRGMAFMACDAGGEPELACAMERVDHCLWISAPCRVEGFEPVEPSAIRWSQEAGPAWYSRYWGTQGWARDTAMSLVVDVGEPPAAPGIRCACRLDAPPAQWPADACLGPHGLCDSPETVMELFRLDDWAPTRGTIAWWLTPTLASSGLQALLEVDLDRGAARMCLIGQHDTYAPWQPPQCAARGHVTFDALPASRADVDAAVIAFEAEFGDVLWEEMTDPFIHDLIISGRIAPGETHVRAVPAGDE